MIGAGDESPFKLDLLTPQFQESHHSVYLELLRRALTEPDVRNIALTGAYGTGKSSVLTRLLEDDRRRNRSLVISLSSLGLDYSSTQQNGAPVEGTKTNQIQKEIVKQILYTVHPGRAPRSRFDRTSRGRTRDGSLLAILIGLVAAAAITFGREVVNGIAHGTTNPVVTFGVSFLAVSSLAYFLRRIVRGRVSVDQLAAGPASISLTSASTSFFDEFLDEIVYFFDVTKCDLVVFEDIDRFDDAGIFETLRALNTLLNSAPQLRRRPVRFIYAMRDSVFQKLEQQLAAQTVADGDAATTQPTDGGNTVDVARDDVERANRTKFFDIVIPVVPFITRENARDIMSKEFRKDALGVSDRLLNIVARHIADMRLVTNVRNEFKVFHHHLIKGPHAVPGLTSDLLLAIVVYKNVHLEDFERVRLGTSNLDLLYRFGRQVVTEQVARGTERATVLRSAIANQDTITFRAEHLGDRLNQMLENFSLQLIAPHGGSVSVAELRTPGFWESVTAGTQYDLRIRGRGGLPATPEFLGTIMREPLTRDRWDTTMRATIERELVRLDHEVARVRRADWASLYRAPQDQTASGETFAAATRRLLQSDLAADLVEHGYLDEYHSQYIAPFYGEQISRRARTFVQQNIDRGVPDELYELDEDDVKAILRDRPHALEDVGIYNVAVLDHLLKNDQPKATAIISTLPRMGAEQANFLRMYAEHGARSTRFIETLAPQWPAVFTYLAEDAPTDPDRLIAMVDAALRSWDAGEDYELSESVREFIEMHYTSLRSLSGPHSSAHAATLAVRAGVKFADLTAVGDGALETVAAASAYPITASNLRRATGLIRISLDELAFLGPPPTFEYVQSRLRDYLDATAGEPTVFHPSRFGDVLTTLGEEPYELLDQVVAAAAPGCVIADIETVPPTVWEPLAAHARFAPTVANLHTYISARGVDRSLATLLETEHISAPEDQATAMAVKVALINASDAIPSPEHRVDLAEQVPTDAYLPADQIPHEPTIIVSLLLEHGLVDDDASTFAPTNFVDGDSFAAAVAVSHRFAQIMTPALVVADRIADLIRHSDVDDAVKSTILADLDNYSAAAPPAAFHALAEFARRTKAVMSEAQLATLHAGGVPAPAIVALVAGSSVEREALVRIVAALGGEYAEVARPGRTKVSLPDDAVHWELIRRLEHAGIVSKASPDKDGTIAVWRHHTAR